MTNNPQTLSLPKYPIQLLGVTPIAMPRRYGGLHNVGGYELFSTSSMKHRHEKRPLSLQQPRMKSRHTQRDLGHESRGTLMRFKSVYDSFCLQEKKKVSHEENIGIFCKLSKNRRGDLASSVLAWHVWRLLLLLQAGCSAVKV